MVTCHKKSKKSMLELKLFSLRNDSIVSNLQLSGFQGPPLVLLLLSGCVFVFWKSLRRPLGPFQQLYFVQNICRIHRNHTCFFNGAFHAFWSLFLAFFKFFEVFPSAFEESPFSVHQNGFIFNFTGLERLLMSPWRGLIRHRTWPQPNCYTKLVKPSDYCSVCFLLQTNQKPVR